MQVEKFKNTKETFRFKNASLTILFYRITCRFIIIVPD